MSHLELLVFFDESGKKVKPSLMGALSVPKHIYQRPEFQALTTAVSQTDIHWTYYRGDSSEKQIITKMLQLLSKFRDVIRFNVINYNQSLLEHHAFHAPEPISFSALTIYTKFPERIIYGLLRKYGRHTHLTAELFIESASEYEKYELNRKIKEQLNVQSLYRGERFQVTSSLFRPKGQEVGLEMTDILLGMIRSIIKNESYADSRSKREKITLILSLLRNPAFFSFLSRISYYEWSHSDELTAIDFKGYLQSFLSQNHELWYAAD